ncbi:hypothetical protein EDC01DRAFT_649901 [Geopyxis carbonaria]|nr:hypothetical protein EDC01DRAFT_649901 [Geopyxis carbonaria]
MSVQYSSRPHQQDPFADPGTWKENNPYRNSLSVSSRQSSRPASSSARHSTSRPRPSHRRSTSYNSALDDVRPLDQIRAETKAANRPRHLKKSSIPGADTIDRLGDVLGGIPYHHDGPYEATLAARQIPGYAPVDAVKESNEAAIRATPRANIIDSLEKHYPMQGTAIYPPGVGGVGDYEEYDVMRRDGGYKRWAHMEYKDEDLKGKGEPSYTIEEFEKQQKAARRKHQNGTKKNEYEMRPTPGSTLQIQPSVRQRSSSGSAVGNASGLDFDYAGGVKRSTSLGRRLRRKLGEALR